MNFFDYIFSNKIINIVGLAWLIAQATKVLIVLLTSKKVDFTRFVGSGGMPSSHSSTVVALATCICLQEGYQSAMFALSFFFAVVVMYDAAGVRRAAGKQAQILNKIVEDLWEGHEDRAGERLKELIGHTPLQVFAGAILGFLLGIILW